MTAASLAAETSEALPALAPGELRRLTADRLSAAGIAVQRRGEEYLVLGRARRPRSRKRERESRWGNWLLSVADEAMATVDFVPWAGADSDPHWLADIAAAFLTGEAGTGQRCLDNASVKVIGVMGVCGLDLRQRGFSVDLNTYVSDDCLEVSADISVTAPGAPGATVWVGPGGSMMWERDYWPECADAGDDWGADGERLAGASAVAAAIARPVAAAINAARPAKAGDRKGAVL